jgi:hypothetical protein
VLIFLERVIILECAVGQLVAETMKTHTCTNNKDALCEACTCTPESILSTCYHEAGHAVAGYRFGITILDVDGHSMTITNNEVGSEVHLDNYDLKHPLLARIGTRYAGAIAQDMHALRCGSGEDVYGCDWVNSDDAERIAEALRLSMDALSEIDADDFSFALGWSSQFIAPEVVKFGDVELDKVKEDLQSSGYEELFNPLWATPLIEAAKSRHKLLKTNWHQVEAVAQRAFKQRTLTCCRADEHHRIQLPRSAG